MHDRGTVGGRAGSLSVMIPVVCWDVYLYGF